MRPIRTIGALGAAVLLSCSREQAAAPADLVLRGGAVYTVDAARSWASAVAVRGGRIVYVGTDSVPASFIGPRTEVADLAGAMVLPGFQDAHVHPVISGVDLAECPLADLPSAAAVLDSIRACARARPGQPWVRGAGWELPLFPAANPTKALLDQAVPDRPAAFEAVDGHSMWANTRALALAGITRDTPDPPNGRIERDPRTREPTGTLRESASDLIYAVLPERTPAERSAGLARALAEANRFGITSMFGADEGKAELEAYAAADRAGTLTVRIVAASSVGEGSVDSVVALARALRTRYTTAHVRPIAVKLFQDGVVEARTAAMLAPYLDRRGDAGTPTYDQPTLDSLAAALDQEGFQIHVHAVGDRAVRMALDAFEYARKQNGARDARHAIAHLQVIDPADIPRFRTLGVVANFEALWANGDEYLTKLADPALGPKRVRFEYPIASVVRSGAVVSGGSDWSVTSLNPLDAIQVGITHRDLGRAAAPWNPEERVDLPTMIALYTINAAWALRQDEETGSIEVGKLADLVVLNRNLFELPADSIHTAKVTRTLLGGRTVYP
jgi:predicted amidohydrolase YtcJ